MRPLPARLQVVHDMVQPVRVAADVGCENAMLAIALVLSGRAQKAIATDVSPSSVERARATVRRIVPEEYVSSVDVRLGDGLKTLEEDERVDTLTMSGIALPRMHNILFAGCSKAGPQTLVLQPLQPRIDRLARLYERLWHSGYSVKEERFVAGEAKRLHSLTLRAELRPFEGKGKKACWDLSKSPPLCGVQAEDEAAYLAFLVSQRDALRQEVAARTRASRGGTENSEMQLEMQRRER